MKYIFCPTILVLFIFVSQPSKAQTKYKFDASKFTVLDTFSEGLAFAAILEHYSTKENTDTFYNTVGYIDTAGNWALTLPFKLTNLYMGCYFRGDPFKHGKALMVMVENGFDCNCGAIISISKRNKIRFVSGRLFDSKNKRIKI
ncbi:MAG: hypothetical protein SGJ10_04630 [Bacteroidota bacterium]|nr:hypothetical protein [Bacteroidota bacterium]